MDGDGRDGGGRDSEGPRGKVKMKVEHLHCGMEDRIVHLLRLRSHTTHAPGCAAASASGSELGSRDDRGCSHTWTSPTSGCGTKVLLEPEDSISHALLHILVITAGEGWVRGRSPCCYCG